MPLLFNIALEVLAITIEKETEFEIEQAETEYIEPTTEMQSMLEESIETEIEQSIEATKFYLEGNKFDLNDREIKSKE